MSGADLPGWRHAYSGKVRDLYLPDRPPQGPDADRILVVASDRISAFDHVLATVIPDKGRILTALSLWWFERLAGLVPHHVITAEPSPGAVPAEVAGRAMVCRRLVMIPVECVARGYLAGSALAEYTRGRGEIAGSRPGTVCGLALPPGLLDGSRLPEPIFTPATKAALGEHDENVDYATVVARVGTATAARIRELTLALYRSAEQIARERGILLADTKLEFGRPAGDSDEIVLADEVLTPDSSRFWPAASWRPGRAQPSFDKQYVRDWLTSPEAAWDRSSGRPPPPLPDRVVERTRERYAEAYRLLTGRAWS